MLDTPSKLNVHESEFCTSGPSSSMKVKERFDTFLLIRPPDSSHVAAVMKTLLELTQIQTSTSVILRLQSWLPFSEAFCRAGFRELHQTAPGAEEEGVVVSPVLTARTQTRCDLVLATWARTLAPVARPGAKSCSIPRKRQSPHGLKSLQWCKSFQSANLVSIQHQR
eukprot:1153237-Amphidinium_carterae.1